MHPPFVETELTFLGAVEGTPVNRFDLDPPQPYPGAKHRVRVHNLRPIADGLSLDRNGLKLVRHPDGALPDFRDAAAVKTRYYPALERLVRENTGAVRAVVFDHTFRSSALTPGAPKQAAGRAPLTAWPAGNTDTVVTRVHNDYTPTSGPDRMREMLGRFAPDIDPDAVMKKRYAIFNVWRPVNGAVEQMPLAMCDMTSMSPSDFVPAENRWKHRTGYVSSVRFQPSHRWYYAPGLDVDEALLFKCYDSAMDRARFTPHSAFGDPAAPSPPPRESIEVRTLVLF